MKLNKYLSILITFCCIFIFLSKVEAEFGTSGVSQNGNPLQSCQGWAWCWQTGYKGIRVTFYDSNGTKISNSLDFAKASSNTWNAKDTVKVNNRNLYSKIDYIDGKSQLNGNKENWVSRAMSDIFTGKIDIKDSYSTEGLSKMFIDDWFLESLGINSKETFLNVFDQFNVQNGSYEYAFFENDITFDEIFSHSEKYYVIVEPTAVISNDGNRYYGTYSELQQLYIYHENNYLMSNTDKKNSFRFIKSLFNNYGGDSKKYHHLAKHIYLNPDKTIDGTGTLVTKLNSMKNNTDAKDLKNAFGIGVIWLGDYYIEEPEPIVPDYFPDCVAGEVNVDPCNDRIVYEYKNCQLNNDASNYIKFDGTNTPICAILCDEKYYVATYQIRNAFNSVVPTNNGYENGLLAGTYFPINGPVVYHKKTCSYHYSESNLNQEIDNVINKYKYNGGCVERVEKCANASCTETYWEDELDETCAADLYQTLYNDYSNNRCGTASSVSLYNRYNNFGVENDQPGEITLTTNVQASASDIFNYELSASLDVTENLSVDLNSDGRYEVKGYKNTYTFGIRDVVNRYISMKDIYDAGALPILNQVYDFGYSNVTTPITLKSGVYNYYVDYLNIFGNTFRSIMLTGLQEGPYYNIANDLDINNSSNLCPYKIVERNINNPCIPKIENNYCGDPDISFNYPKIRFQYRPIDLSIPFPGKNHILGSNRNSGSNWDNFSISSYITNNRGVKENAVYQKQALYVIELDANAITKIREYNNDNGYDDFTLTCTDGTGTECFSRFLRDNDLINSGTCLEESKENFYSCADK